MAYQPREAETIKSVTLADLQFGRPRPFDRVAGFAKTMLMLWGALTFGAATGTAAYYLAGSAGAPVLATQVSEPVQPAPRPAPQVAAAEIPAPAKPTPTPAIAEIPPPIVEARLPRPRPDEPVFTGSVERPRYTRARRIGPCEALEAIGARFIFGMRCQREVRYAPPPPARLYYYQAPARPVPVRPTAEYQPQPYRPPTVVR